jgi:thiol-disulfide isomerase/thioredoxin
MIQRSHLIIVVLALAGAAAGMFMGQWLQPRPRGGAAYALVGAARADFQRPDAAGQPHRIGEWDGHLVVLNFWASWCGPCRAEMPLLDRTAQRHAGQGLAVIGVAVDDAVATRDFLKDNPVGYPILVDDPQKGSDLSVTFGNNRSVLPYTVLIGRDGRILAQHLGSFSETLLEDWLKPHL